ncbi:MAG: 3-dehydroquinate synthase [Clostridiales bacterium]|nr:3-dehydroquinate synthase [Clostridiales bacterium]
MAREIRVPVHVPGAGYDVVIGTGVLDEAGRCVREVSGAHALALISDETVYPLYGERVAASLAAAGFRVAEIVIPPGEPSKSWERAGAVVERLAAEGIDRTGAIVACGGGVVGDLAGFVAAVYLRGVDYVQVPTTLLAQVDSSVGGKTGVDLAAGKNLVGAFKQPRIVLADTETLRTLPEAEWSSGLAEVAKAAMLESHARVAWLIDHAEALIERDNGAVIEAVRGALALKVAVVEADERESGERESLNYGHTLGHAIERVAGYGAVPHGAAVAEGMRFAAYLAEEAVGASFETGALQERLLGALGIKRPHYPRDAVALVDAMRSDKKARGGSVRYVFVPEPGGHVVIPVDETLLVRTLTRWLENPEERGADR